MITTILILIAIQTVWMIYRDGKLLSYQSNLKALEEHHDHDKKVMRGNFETAMRELEHWHQLYCQELEKNTESKPVS